MEIFSARLKWLRNNKGFTQAKVAERIGMSSPGYTKIENGQREPKLETLAKLVVLLEESADFLLGVTDLTSNIAAMYAHFDSALINVAQLKNDLEMLQIDPFNPKIFAKDYIPDDPVSVSEKIDKITKALPLWEERCEIARTKVIKMIEDIPFVSEKTLNEIYSPNYWLEFMRVHSDLQEI